MKTYIGTKIIQADPMNALTFAATIRPIPDLMISTDPQSQPGYKVVYPDGYISWSPKNVFEAAYREVTPEEKTLLI